MSHARTLTDVLLLVLKGVHRENPISGGHERAGHNTDVEGGSAVETARR